MRFRLLAALPVAAGLALAALGAAPVHADTRTHADTPARADSTAADPTLSHATTVGLHNTYNRDAFDYLARALDTGTSMIELDVWDDIVTQEWKVSHGSPLGNDNNCVAASTPDQLYTGGANKDLEHCLDDVRVWLGAHPGHPPLTIKIELKAGFDSRAGMGPTELDEVVADHLGDAVFTPADLLARPGGGTYATLDAAARADNWPGRSALAGRVLLEIIPGTVEEQNPTDTLWTDVEYARHLRDLSAAGNLADAQIFPSVHNAAAGDPRTRYDDADLRGWFVVFDGDATAYTGIDTSWYDTNHYLLIMTDAQNVPPVIDEPTTQQAADRVALLAAAHASIVSCDWTGLPDVLSSVSPRG